MNPLSLIGIHKPHARSITHLAKKAFAVRRPTLAPLAINPAQRLGLRGAIRLIGKLF